MIALVRGRGVLTVKTDFFVFGFHIRIPFDLSALLYHPKAEMSRQNIRIYDKKRDKRYKSLKNLAADVIFYADFRVQ